MGPQRWAYTFQTCAFLSRMKAQHQSVGAEHPGSAVTVFERSVHSDRTCFAANCHASGVLGDMEYSVYCDFHSFLVTSLGGMKLDGVVYLRADPDTCMRRLKLRDRTEEAAVPLDYLEALGKRHEDWLMHRSVTSPGCVRGLPRANCWVGGAGPSRAERRGQARPEWKPRRAPQPTRPADPGAACGRLRLRRFDPDTPVLVLDCNPDFNEDGEQRSVLLRQTRSFFDRLTDAANAGQQRAQGGGGAEGPAVREPSPDLF